MVTRPSTAGDPLMSSTSQAIATICIQVPVPEMSCPVQKSAKFRTRSARNRSTARRGGGAPGAIPGTGGPVLSGPALSGLRLSGGIADLPLHGFPAA
ncbi:hypothetical protein GCM10009825_20860 [Arthrobacter humicola]|uniref:Uncharacterized protein n=1 Tax=Arthrobacter humicola TaxID=409291 RepID=A0ABN2Z369_9MICC